jgi:hypothetical protein
MRCLRWLLDHRMPCLLNKGFSTQNPDHEFSRKLQSKIALHMPQNEMSSRSKSACRLLWTYCTNVHQDQSVGVSMPIPTLHVFGASWPGCKHRLNGHDRRGTWYKVQGYISSCTIQGEFPGNKLDTIREEASLHTLKTTQLPTYISPHLRTTTRTDKQHIQCPA